MIEQQTQNVLRFEQAKKTGNIQMIDPVTKLPIKSSININTLPSVNQVKEIKIPEYSSPPPTRPKTQVPPDNAGYDICLSANDLSNYKKMAALVTDKVQGQYKCTNTNVNGTSSQFSFDLSCNFENNISISGRANFKIENQKNIAGVVSLNNPIKFNEKIDTVVAGVRQDKVCAGGVVVNK
jgi:hypothetical protein